MTTATRSLKKTTATARVVTEVDPRATPTPVQATALINQKQLALMPAACLLLFPVEHEPRKQKMKDTATNQFTNPQTAGPLPLIQALTRLAKKKQRIPLVT